MKIFLMILLTSFVVNAATITEGWLVKEVTLLPEGHCEIQKVLVFYKDGVEYSRGNLFRQVKLVDDDMSDLDADTRKKCEVNVTPAKKNAYKKFKSERGIK